MNKNKHIGSSFDGFLEEEGIRAEVEAVAVKRVLAHQIHQAMKSRKLTKSRMAVLMKTSRTAVERLLDPANSSVTLNPLERAAVSLGRRLKIELVSA